MSEEEKIREINAMFAVASVIELRLAEKLRENGNKNTLFLTALSMLHFGLIDRVDIWTRESGT